MPERVKYKVEVRHRRNPIQDNSRKERSREGKEEGERSFNREETKFPKHERRNKGFYGIQETGAKFIRNAKGI